MLAHNKTLAAQLCSEFREFFPNNAVEFFVSYYDYYQPEAYIPSTDTYIEKDSDVNSELDRLRHSATSALFERRDVIIVASVSCIYSLGDPIDYANMVISLRTGQQRDRDEICRKLVDIQYERNDVSFDRNRFRVRGDTLEIHLAYTDEYAIRVEFFGDEIDRISEINIVTGQVRRVVDHVAIYPASHYVTPRDKLEVALQNIEQEMNERVAFFEKEGKLIEAQRIKQRTSYDMEMLREIGVGDVSEIYRSVIPEDLLFQGEMDLPDPIPSEQALKRHMNGLLAQNTSTAEALSFLGAGCYQRYIPAVCDEIANRSEFLTAYCGDTYSDHGKMQAIFEYASMMAELLELDVVSYPTYDAGQAVSSSFRMAFRLRPDRKEILIPAHMSPEIRSQAEAYCAPFGTLVPVADPGGILDLEDLKAKLSENRPPPSFWRIPPSWGSSSPRPGRSWTWPTRPGPWAS